MKCLNCDVFTKNPRFCSRSCAATYNNKAFPKRLRKRGCKKCKTPILSGYSYCEVCWVVVKNERQYNFDDTLLGDIRIKSNSNHGKSGYVRAKARKAYIDAGLPLECKICKYSLHVDIAHIIGIRQHSDATPISVINQLSNLVALCKNHHWEYDSGYLILPM